MVERTARSFGFELQGTLVGCRLFLISSHQELGANRLRRDGGNDVNDPEPTWTGLKSRSAALEVYDIAGNTLAGAASLGAVGLDWQLGGFAADPPSPSTASMGDSSQAAQLVQTMAGFNGGSAAENMSPIAPGADMTPTGPVNSRRLLPKASARAGAAQLA